MKNTMENQIEKQYEPFGEEWEKTLTKLPKKFIIDMYRKSCKDKLEYERLISSESVYTLLRYGTKNPSSSGVDDCEPERLYYDLYNISVELRKSHSLTL